MRSSAISLLLYFVNVYNAHLNCVYLYKTQNENMLKNVIPEIIAHYILVKRHINLLYHTIKKVFFINKIMTKICDVYWYNSFLYNFLHL